MLTKLMYGFRNIAAVVALGCVSAPAMAVPFYFTTGQSGQQSQIDVNHTSSWAFTAASAWELGGGNFTMKDGSSTNANVSLTLYQGTSASGTVLRNLTYTTTQFCGAHGGNCQSFSSTDFYFANSIFLTAGTQYFLALTSTALDTQSTAYFIKGLGSASIANVGGTPLPGQTFNEAVVVVPEPASIALLGLGLAGIGVIRRRA